jgi:hypothetical protein
MEAFIGAEHNSFGEKSAPKTEPMSLSGIVGSICLSMVMNANYIGYSIMIVLL